MATPLTDRLGYLLKHAQLRLFELTAAAMEPFGITGRQCAVLVAIDDSVPRSQQDVARRLGVDRSTMVDLIDELEAKGLVERRTAADDRRKNVVALTGTGRDILRAASAAGAEAERLFLAGVSDADQATFRGVLGRLVAPPAAR
jgi:DNA-binding MarR family transcriptional regulator